MAKWPKQFYRQGTCIDCCVKVLSFSISLARSVQIERKEREGHADTCIYLDNSPKSYPHSSTHSKIPKQANSYMLEVIP